MYGTQTLIPGSPDITVDGMTLSLGQSGVLANDTSTTNLAKPLHVPVTMAVGPVTQYGNPSSLIDGAETLVPEGQLSISTVKVFLSDHLVGYPNLEM